MTDGVIIFLITQTVAFVVALFKIYVQVTVKMRELELRIQQNEEKDSVIFKKLDNIAEQIHELYLELSKK
jgi:hypothetical protein